jgi:post-segregation antitoxin (ccd killing protein)
MLHVELAPDLEQRLIEAARAEGLDPSAYASLLLASSLALTREKHLSKEELEAFFAGMARHSDKIPDLPDEAYTRESFYQDHD